MIALKMNLKTGIESPGLICHAHVSKYTCDSQPSPSRKTGTPIERLGQAGLHGRHEHGRDRVGSAEDDDPGSHFTRCAARGRRTLVLHFEQGHIRPDSLPVAQNGHDAGIGARLEDADEEAQGVHHAYVLCSSHQSCSENDLRSASVDRSARSRVLTRHQAPSHLHRRQEPVWPHFRQYDLTR